VHELEIVEGTVLRRPKEAICAPLSRPSRDLWKVALFQLGPIIEMRGVAVVDAADPPFLWSAKLGPTSCLIGATGHRGIH